MRLTDRQLQAVLDACLEAEAGATEEWADEIVAALAPAIEKLRKEYHRRQERRPHLQPRRKGVA
jgi:hypothetical protein